MRMVSRLKACLQKIFQAWKNNKPFAGLFIDSVLPELDGYTVIKNLRRGYDEINNEFNDLFINYTKSLPITLLSPFDKFDNNQKQNEQTIQSGANFFLYRPVAIPLFLNSAMNMSTITWLKKIMSNYLK